MEQEVGYENQVLPGVGRLGKRLEESNDHALYEAEFSGVAGPLAVEIRRGDTQEADARLNRWHDSIALTHPHLIRLYAAGSSVLDEIRVIFLVEEKADESLAGVLEERTLSEQEAREMLEPVLSALIYLHSSGYAHGNLVPAKILAAGETLKLSSESVYRVSESGNDLGGGPSDDMRAVGVLLVQALTRSNPEDAELSIFRETSEPLRKIVRHCLDPDLEKRWTAAQALESLSPEAAAPPAPDLAANPLPMTEQGAPPFEAPRMLQPPPARPVLAAEEPHSTNRKWIYGAAAAVLLIAATVGLTKNESVAPNVVRPVELSNPVPTAKPSAAKEISPAKVPARSATAPSVTRPHDLRATGWTVVVASYSARGPAEKRARDLSRKWPKFHVDVFQPPSQQTRHLVVIGKNLSEDKAEALRKRARASGLPADTYIKRF